MVSAAYEVQAELPPVPLPPVLPDPVVVVVLLPEEPPPQPLSAAAAPPESN